MEAVIITSLLMGISVLWPQSSYIHPDEFFQSTEIVSGDVFNITHLRTWEFDPEVPLRDVCVPYMLFGPGFYALRVALGVQRLSHLVSKPYAVTVAPRLTLLLLGVVSLRLVWRLSRAFAVDARRATWLWATSYFVWTFLARPFSNTAETLLFSLVCLLVLDLSEMCCVWSAVPPVRREGPLSPTAGGCRFGLCSFVLGCVLCVGLFNRPTFGLFVFVPLMWWFDRLSAAKLRHQVHVVSVVLTGVGFVLAFAAMAVANSLYYNPHFAHLLSDLLTSVIQGDWDAVTGATKAVVVGLRIPPWNFLQYNLQAANLAQHGLHPWYTHIAANVPLLLGPLALLLYADIAALLWRCWQKQACDVLYAMVVLPVLSLSLFPHQEARFLLPLLPVAVVCVARNKVSGWKSFQAAALLFNMAAFLLFGWLHQGGVVPALSLLQSRLEAAAAGPGERGSHFHVVAFSTYMLPRHLLFAHRHSGLHVHVHDMIGAHNHLPTFRYRMDELSSSCRNKSERCRFFLLSPVPAAAEVESIPGWRFKEEARVCPHISMERPPTSFTLRSISDLYSLASQLCLKVISIEM